MTATVHSLAVVDPKARLGKGVSVGPFCVVGPDVELGDDVRLISHVCIEGHTSIGERTVIFPFSSIGHPPQDRKYNGEASRLIIGTDNVIRESVTMQPGTEGGCMETRVGNHCLFMLGTHVAHDCTVGNHVIMANHATLAGHVTVDDYVIIGGLAGIHQRVRIGKHAIIGGLSAVDGDVIPYGSVKGERAFLNGLNIIGLKRRGFGREDIDALREAYGLLFAQEGTLNERLQHAAALYKEDSYVKEMVSFMQEESKQGICLPQ